MQPILAVIIPFPDSPVPPFPGNPGGGPPVISPPIFYPPGTEPGSRAGVCRPRRVVGRRLEEADHRWSRRPIFYPPGTEPGQPGWGLPTPPGGGGGGGTQPPPYPSHPIAGGPWPTPPIFYPPGTHPGQPGWGVPGAGGGGGGTTPPPVTPGGPVFPGQLPAQNPTPGGWVYAFVPGYGWMWIQLAPAPPAPTEPPPTEPPVTEAPPPRRVNDGMMCGAALLVALSALVVALITARIATRGGRSRFRNVVLLDHRHTVETKGGVRLPTSWVYGVQDHLIVKDKPV